MTQIFEPDGSVYPATVIKAGPCVVVQAKTPSTDGYEAVQLGLVEETPAKVRKPLAGHYKSKADFVAGTFAKLGKVLPNGAQLHVDSLIVHDDVAIVELHSEATARNGLRFDNHYCWVCYFKDNTIVRVRAYLDSVMVARLFAENPIG